MHHEQIGIARRQLKGLGDLFQRLFVRRMPDGTFRASYHVSIGANGRRIFHKDVNMITQESMGSGHDLVRLPSALQALNEHFSNAFIAQDALSELYQFRVDAYDMKPGTLQECPMFGKEVYHADLEELHLPNDAYINLH